MRVCPRRSHDEAKKRGCVGALACLPTLHNNFPDIPPPPSSTPPAQKSPIFIKKANLCLPLELHSQRQAILQSNPQPVRGAISILARPMPCHLSFHNNEVATQSQSLNKVIQH